MTDLARSSPQRITVLGAGSWGTAFAKVLADAGREVTLWSRRAEVAAEITEQATNARYLPDVELPARLAATSDAPRALAGAEAVVLAVPSQHLRENLAVWHGLLPASGALISLAKGVELGTLKRMSQVIVEVTGVDERRIVVVSGPNIAAEIAQGQPSAAVLASTDHEQAVAVQRAGANGYFRAYTHTDVTGCELGGACKNVIALACGIAVGLGYGLNTVATLMTRGLAEIARLGTKLGADPMTFSGLAGIGDLVATCCSPLSRNRSFGERIGRGATLVQAQEATGGQISEGVKSCSSIRELAHHHGVEMPLTEAMYGVCHQGRNPRDISAELLERAQKPEWG